MVNFKKGDRVRFVENYGRAAVGTEGVITGFWSEGVKVDVNGEDHSCYSSRVEHAPLIIEAGKFYTTRGGRLVGPMREWFGNFIEKEGDSRLWKDTGTYIGRAGLDADLIAEAEAPAYTANAAVQSDNLADEYGCKAKPKFKVGDRVKVVRHCNHRGDKIHMGVEVGSIREIVSINQQVNGVDCYHLAGDSKYFYTQRNLEPAATHAIVAVIEDGQPKPATRPYVHADRTAAKSEAERLAGINKGKTFGVYELVDEVSVEKTYDHEWQRLAAGGERVKAVKALRDIAGISLKAAVDAVDYVKAAA